MDHGMGDRDSSSLRIGCTKFSYGCTSGFNVHSMVEKLPLITFQGSPKDQMDHGKGYKGLGSLMIKCTKFS